MKLFRRTFYFLTLLLVGIFIYLDKLHGLPPQWLWQHRFSDELRPTAHFIDVQNRTLHYIDTNEPDKPVLLLIHGSPGNWNAYINYFTDPLVRETFRVIAPDRPGFGYSGNGKPELSVAKQADDIAAIFENIPTDTPIIVAGHSYGGPVAAQIAMTYPERVHGLVLLAASTDPDLEEVKTIQLIARWPIIRWFVPALAYSTNEEILALQAELERMKPQWEQIVAPTIIVHGDADTLVPIGNAAFSQQMLTNAQSVSVIRSDTMNHFIVWNQYDLVRQAFFDILEEATK